MAGLLRRVGWAMIGFAVLLGAFLGHQLFLTNLINGRVQAEAHAALAEQLEARRVALPEPSVVPVADNRPNPSVGAPSTLPPIVLVGEEGGDEGTALGRLVIHRLDLDVVMFEGVSPDVLQLGPGHIPGTPVPGQPGNAVVSGHRTTYGRPFYDLDTLVPGDRIEVETAIGLHVYEVWRTFVVDPDEVWVAGPASGAWLTLTTCNPRFSAAERLIVKAEMVSGPNLAYAHLPSSGELRRGGP